MTKIAILSSKRPTVYNMLAVWESSIGVFLITNNYQRLAIILAFIPITLIFTPLVVFPELKSSQVPFSFTLLGQYIAKNIIIIGALITVLKETNTALKKIE